MEGLISQHKQLDDMASSSGVNDGRNEDAGSTEKKTSLGPRKERSLTVVCDRVINVFMENGVTNIGELSNRSGQRVRRIYDVLNIFQALGLIDKAGGRKFNWRGTNGLNETLHRFRIESDDSLWNSFINFCKENSSMSKSVVTSKKRKFDEKPQSAGSSKMNILVKATEFFVKIVMQAKENSMHVHNQELLLTLIEEKKDIFKEDTLSRRLYDIKNILMHIGLLETIETRSKKKNKKVNCFRFINGTKFKWDEESNNNPSNPDREEQSSSLAASANEEPSLTEEDGRFQSDLAGPSRPALCDLSNVENVVRKTSTPFSMDDILAVPDKSNICLPPLCPSWSAQSDLSDAENVVRKTNTPFSVDNILSSPEKIRRPSFAPCVQNANTGSPVNTFCPVSRAQTFSGHTYHQNTNPGFVGVASLQYLNALALLQNMNGRFVGPSSFRGMNAFVGIQSMNALGSIQNLNALALLQNMNGGKRIE